MKHGLSRRSMLTSLAVTGAAAFAPSLCESQTNGLGVSPSHQDCSLVPRRIDVQTLIEYFDSTVPLLLRPPQGILNYPSIAPSLPGKAYNAQLWDWDTLWTARGLFAYANLKKDAAFKSKVAEHARGSLLDFLAQQNAEGRIPTMMNSTQGDHFDSLNPAHNPAKPVMAQLALLIAEETGDATWLTAIFDKLVAFHDAWLKTNKSDIGLLVWSNGIGIGNDNDPTTSGRPPFSSANPLLNCLFFQDLHAAASLAGLLGKGSVQDELTHKADAFGKLIQTILWDPRDRFFYTHDVLCYDDRRKFLPGQPRGMEFSYHSLPMRIATFTGFLPLWAGIATPEQAKLLLDEAWRRDDRFRAHFGCRTLSSRETMYSLAYSSNPSNWLGPIWIIANYLVWRALKNYGTKAEANELAYKTIRLLTNDLAVHGSLNEYYHPDTGEALSHSGFMDWNLLVLEMVQSI